MSELKETALLESISRLTSEYENKIADLRVALTQAAQEVTTLRQERERTSAPEDVLEGSVVE